MARSAVRFFLTFVFGFGVPVVATAAAFTTTANGNWSIPATWGGVGPPGPGDSATIFHNVVLDVPVTVASVTLNAGSIGASVNTLDVTSSFAWAGGTIGGGGGTLNILPTSTLTISGATAKTLANFTISNASATSTWAAGASNILFSQTAIFNNSGTLTIQNDAALAHNGDGGAPAFNNSGTLRKLTATGTTIIGSVSPLPFNNTGGTIDFQTGTLQLSGSFNVTTAAGALTAGILEVAGGGTSTADWSVAGGATMKFLASGYTIGGTWSGASGSTYWINGATANVVVNGALSGDTINLSSGTLRGTGTITPATAFNWSGGTIGGAAPAVGSLNVGVAATLTISGATAKTLSNFTINNSSPASAWAAGASGILFSQTAVFNNSGVFTIQNDAALSHNGDGGAPAFNNSGTLRKLTATGTTIIGSVSPLPFNNTGGTIDFQTGTLQLSGSFNVTTAAGALTAGILEVAGGGTSTADWSVAGGATMKFLASGYTIGGTWSGASGSTYWINGATANVVVNGALSGDTINLSSGTLRGTGTITPATAFNWSGGTIGGAAPAVGSLNVGVAATLTISGATAKTLSNFTINNSSPASAWAAGASGILFSQTAVFNNSGMFTIQNDAALSHNGDGGAPAFNNSGTLRKLTATGTTIIGSVSPLPFNNTGGTIDFQTGTLQLNGSFNVTTAAGALTAGILEVAGGGTSTADWSVAGGATMKFLASGYTIGGTWSGASGSTYWINGATANVVVNGALSGDTINLSSGTLRGTGTITPATAFDWSGGTIGGAAPAVGSLNVGAAATLTISGATAKTLANFTINNGSPTSTWAAGASGILFSQTAVFTNSGMLTIQNDAALSHNGDGGSPAFNNSGTFRKQTATGATTIGSVSPLPFDNTGGTIDLESGTVSVLGSFTQNASSHLKFGIAGTSSSTQYGVLSINGGINLAGATLTAYPLSGFVPGPADSFQIVSAGSVSGTFGTVNTMFGGGVVLQPQYNPANVTLVYGNAGTLSFSSPSYSAGESAGTAVLTVNRTGGSQGAVSASYATADVSATSGSDYTGTSTGNVSFLDGETTKNFTIPILDDSTDESDETFTVTLSTPTNGAVLGAAASATVQINDDDLPPTVQFTTASQASVNESGSLTITASLSQVSAFNVSVPFSVDGTSTASGADYAVPTSSPLTILAGSLTATITINITGDSTDEANETVVVTLGSPTNATLGTTITHTATITDDDLPPTIQFASPSQASINESGTMTVTVQLSALSSFNVTAPFSIDPSSTASGSDYGITLSPISIPAGSSSGDATITITTDLTDEPGETVVLTLDSPTNATLGATTTHTATITDDEGQPSVQFQSVVQNVAETGMVTVTLQLSALSAQTVTVPFAIDPSSTAADPADYNVTTPTPVTISAGSLTGSVSINVNPDALDELDETIVLTLGSPTNATLGAQTTHTATITDDDAPPTVQFQSASQTSANESGTMGATVTLSTASGQTVTVPFSVDGSSTTSVSDYSIAATSPLTFTPGVTTMPVNIAIVSDSIDEDAETVVLTLGAATNAGAGAPATHTATVTDDDAPPTVQFVSASQSSAGESGTMTVTAQLSNPSSFNVTVPFSIGGASTATAADYSITASPITIPAGAVTGSATITITTDGFDEAVETIVINMGSPANATAGATTTHTASITDDDGAPTVQFVSASQASGGESGTMTVTVQLSNTSSFNVTVPFSVDGSSTATAADYSITPSPITIPAGSLTGSATITIIGDFDTESSETVVLTLGTPTNAALGATTTHTATITDDDAAPAASFSIASTSVVEGNGGSAPLTFTVTLSAPLPGTATVDYQTSDGSATSPSDYTPASATLTFPAGQTSQSIAINVLGDTAFESDETFFVTLSNAFGATISSGTASGTITNDDLPAPPLQISVSEISGSEGDSGIIPFTFTIQLSAPSGGPVHVQYQTHDGSATAGLDYLPASGTVSFAAGEVGKQITIGVIGDLSLEQNEFFTLSLSNAVGATLAIDAALATIVNDDELPSGSADLAVTIRQVLDGPIEPQRYLVTVRNDGPATATGVHLVYEMPHYRLFGLNGSSQLRDVAILAAAVASQGTCKVRPAQGQAEFTTTATLSVPTTVVCDMGTLAAAAEATLDVTLLLTKFTLGAEPENAEMTAHVASGVPDGDPSDNRAINPVVVPDDLGPLVTVEHHPHTPPHGGLVTLVVRAYDRMDGGSLDNRVRLAVDLPLGLQPISATVDDRPCSIGGGSHTQPVPQETATTHVRCSATMPGGGMIEATIVGQITKPGHVEAFLYGTVGPPSGNDENYAARGEDFIPAPLVGGEGDLSTAIIAVGKPNTEPQQYRVTVSNGGPASAPGVRVVYEVPHSRNQGIVRDVAILVRASPSQGHCTVLPGEIVEFGSTSYSEPTTVVCEMGTMAADAMATIDVTLLLVVPIAGMELFQPKMTAHAVSAAADGDLTNNRSELVVTIVEEPRPLLTLDFSPAAPVRGTLVTLVARAYSRQLCVTCPPGFRSDVRLAFDLPPGFRAIDSNAQGHPCVVGGGSHSNPTLNETQGTHVVCEANLSFPGVVEAQIVGQITKPSHVEVFLHGSPGLVNSPLEASVDIPSPVNVGAQADLAASIEVLADGNEGPKRYRASVVNHGPATATGVRLIYELPHFATRPPIGDVPSEIMDAAILIASETSQGTCSIRPRVTRRVGSVSVGQAGALVCEMGTLAPSAAATLDVTVLPTAVDPDIEDVKTTVLVAGDVPDGDLDDNRADLEVSLSAADSPVITLDHEPGLPALGGLVTIVARAYDGLGPANCSSDCGRIDHVTLAVDLPQGVRAVSAVVGDRPCLVGGGSYFDHSLDVTQNTYVVCQANLASPGMAEARITAQISVGTAYVEAFLISSHPSGSEDYSARADEIITVAGVVPPPADLSIEKNGPADVVRGGIAEYQIRVTNMSATPAVNVVVIDPVPPGLSLKRVVGACTSLPCSIPILGPGQSRNVGLVFDVLAAAGAGIINTASVTETGKTDPKTANNSSTARSRVRCTTPAAPAIHAVASIASDSKYLVSWTANGDATEYQLQQATASDFSDATTQSTRSSTLGATFQNKVERDTVYYYRVRAVASCDGSNGTYSRVAQVRVLAPPPPVSTTVSQPTTVTPYGSKDPVQTTMKFPATKTKSTFTASADRTWVTVSPTSGVVPETGLILGVTMDPARLPVGASFGTVSVTYTPAPSAGGITTHETNTVMSVPISLSLVTPVTPSTREFPPPAGTVVIPGVAHADGVGTQWRSDVRIANPSSRAVSYLVTYVSTQNETAGEVKETTLTIEAGNTTALEDVVRTWFGTSGTGMLEIRPLEGTFKVIATSRTYNSTAAGTLGQFVPAIAYRRFASQSSASISTLHLPQIAQSALYRTNVGLVEGSGADVHTLVRFLGTDGGTLLEVPVLVRGGEHRQLNSLLQANGINAPDARVEVSITDGTGKVTGYASVIDNRSGDAQLVAPARLPAQATRLVLPGVGSITTPSSRWRSDVHLFNSGTSTATATFSYFTAGSSAAAKSMELVLEPGSTRAMNDVIGALDMAGTMGVIHITSPSAARLIASARTYDDQPHGTYGQFISAVTSDDGVGVGEAALQILQADESVHSRTNVGLFEVSGQPVRVEVTASVPDWKTSPVVEFDLEPNEFIQVGSLLRQMNLEPAYNARISIRAVGGTGRVAGFASSVDNHTQDPTYIPAQ